MLDSGGNVKVGDFGFACELSSRDEKKRTMCGTPNYIAPEVLNSNKVGSRGYSFEVDIWSLGVVLYTLAVGRPPFETKEVPATYQRIKACQYSFPLSSNVPPSLQALIKAMLQLHPEDRPTLLKLRDHSFFHNLPPRPLSLCDLDTDISPRRPSVRESGLISSNPGNEVQWTEHPQSPAKYPKHHAVYSPNNMVVMFIHFPRYGWCYKMWNDGDTKFEVVGAVLNDRSKILHDPATDELWYINRVRQSSENQPQKGYDEVRYFQSSEDAACARTELSAMEARQLEKKLAIIRFMEEFIETNSTKGMSTNVAVAQKRKLFMERETFGDKAIDRNDIVYVKEILELDDDSGTSGVAFRFSTGAAQIFLTSRDGAHKLDYIVQPLESTSSPASQHGEQWLVSLQQGDSPKVQFSCHYDLDVPENYKKIFRKTLTEKFNFVIQWPES